MQAKIGTGLVLAVAALLLLAAAGTLCAQETAAENGQADSTNAVSADPGREELESMIGAAVATRLRPLVREIRDLKDEIRLHDIPRRHRLYCRACGGRILFPRDEEARSIAREGRQRPLRRKFIGERFELRHLHQG